MNGVWFRYVCDLQAMLLIITLSDIDTYMSLLLNSFVSLSHTASEFARMSSIVLKGYCIIVNCFPWS